MQKMENEQQVFGMEHKRQPMLSNRQFAWRVLRHVGMAAIIVLLSLALGMIGYRVLENMSWMV